MSGVCASTVWDFAEVAAVAGAVVDAPVVDAAASTVVRAEALETVADAGSAIAPAASAEAPATVNTSAE
jgi:hypothetical protein